MESWKLNTPVVLFIYKRPYQTLQVFQSIREAKPTRLYIIADGPKNQDELQGCIETRQIIDSMDWDCSVRKNFSETNLGLRKRIISGLDWVFDIEDAVIILEDDCLPHPTFFRFCEELLSYYEKDSRVMHISGDNFFFGKKVVTESYYFSRVAHVWGWATWKRAWKLFHSWDFNNSSLDQKIFQNKHEKNYWLSLLEQLRQGEQNYTWDYQWSLTCLAHLSKCIMPDRNLISNIGFGVQATNTLENTSSLSNLITYEMQFPLVHPKNIDWNNSADRRVASKFLHRKTIWSWDNFLFELVKLAGRMIKWVYARILK